MVVEHGTVDIGEREARPPAGGEPGRAVAIEPGRWLYQPESWFVRLDPVAMFGRQAPLELELGSGDGSFVVNWARRHPDRDFVGVERLLGRVRKVDRKAQRAGLTNVRGLRIEAGYCLEYLMPPGSVAALHVYFPDPWPKRRHRKNRLIDERFPGWARVALAPGGTVYLRTDDEDYFGQMKRVFGAAAGFGEVPTPDALAEVTTDFEQDFNAKGIPTRRAAYEKRD